MATHSNTLAWKIPWMEEPGRLQYMGSLGVGHDWSDLAAAAAATQCIRSDLISQSSPVSRPGECSPKELEIGGGQEAAAQNLAKTVFPWLCVWGMAGSPRESFIWEKALWLCRNLFAVHKAFSQPHTSLALAAGLCPKYYYPISKGRKLRFTEVKQLVQGHPERKQQHVDLSSGHEKLHSPVLMPQATLLRREGELAGARGGQMPS